MKIMNTRYSVVFAATFVVFTWVGAVSSQSIKISKNPQLASIAAQSRRVRRAPRSLTPVEKLKTAQQVLSSKGEKASSVGTTTLLNASALCVSPGCLTLRYPTIVISNGIGGYIDLGPNPLGSFGEGQSGILAGFLNLPIGKYLVDIRVAGSAGTIFSIANELNVDTTTSSQGLDHLTFLLDIKQSNSFTDIYLTADQPWVFYSLELTPIK